MPSTSTSVKSDSPPRGNSEVTLPRPPLRETVSARHRPQRVGHGLDLQRAQVAGGQDRHRVGRAREGQLDLRGRHDDRLGDRADVQRHAHAGDLRLLPPAPSAGSARNPSAVARSSYRPGGTWSNRNSPAPSVLASAMTAPLPAATSSSVAPGTRAPSGSTTVPATRAGAGSSPGLGAARAGRRHQGQDRRSQERRPDDQSRRRR